MLLALAIEFDLFASVFLTIGVLSVFGLWFFYERREAILSDSHRLSTTFHCIKCELIYTRLRRRETSPCPRCGFTNTRLKF